ncbi:hypothetical protein B8W69_29055 [Mycobacterium vulneris]|uniref:Uncharacterized protein n=1 Tax=Mycolicibacterium vulneris TaxID=547163 RepID=A0A1X2KHW8_9MYCO|nr:hypothetical protein [Mycolicibacterium vulneris]OSC20077.1 hypothetical protein B8W69_29055 [Mycolicibacterium vulneris]
MRVVFGVAFIAIMGAVFTVMTAVIFVTQHLFASAVIAGVTAAALVSIARRRRKARCSHPAPGYLAVSARTQPHPVRGTPAQMSSAAVPARRHRPALAPRSVS